METMRREMQAALRAAGRDQGKAEADLSAILARYQPQATAFGMDMAAYSAMTPAQWSEMMQRFPHGGQIASRPVEIKLDLMIEANLAGAFIQPASRSETALARSAPPPTTTTYVSPDAQTCQRYGYAPGATGFADCMMQIDIARQAQARAAAEHNQRLAAYQQQVAQQERERRDERSMQMLELGLRLMTGGSVSGGSYGSAAPLPPPPPSTAPWTIRLPNGNQIYCQTIGNNTTCN
jgi:hypothetical protein